MDQSQKTELLDNIVGTLQIVTGVQPDSLEIFIMGLKCILYVAAKLLVLMRVSACTIPCSITAPLGICLVFTQSTQLSFLS